MKCLLKLLYLYCIINVNSANLYLMKASREAAWRNISRIICEVCRYIQHDIQNFDYFDIICIYSLCVFSNDDHIGLRFRPPRARLLSNQYRGFLINFHHLFIRLFSFIGFLWVLMQALTALNTNLTARIEAGISNELFTAHCAHRRGPFKR